MLACFGGLLMCAVHLRPASSQRIIVCIRPKKAEFTEW